MTTLNKMASTAALLLVFISFSKAQVSQDTSLIVNGVCGMCQYTIETAVLNLDGADSAQWNEDTKVLKLTYDAEKLSLLDISNAINKSGYDTEYNTAPDSAYFSLHKCCHYRDPQVIKDHEKNGQ